MPIIYSYPLINTVKDSDQFIISVAPTDSEDTFETRNVTYETLRDSILAGSTSGTVESITFVAPLTGGTITDTGSVSLPQANSSTDGYLSSTDWTAFNAKQNISEKGQANGYAPLNAFTKIDVQYLPDSLIGAVVYQGTWNAGTNTPTLPAPDPNNKGYYYVVSDPGTYLGVTYGIGDWVISNGTDWEKVDNSQSVTSVNGQQGVVVLTTSDIAEGANLYYTDARVALAPSVVANTAKVSFPGFGTTAGTALEGDTVIPAAYTDADVDAHLNLSTAQFDQVLGWNGNDYIWVNQSSGSGGSVTEITASGGLTTGTGSPITSTGDISIDPTGTIGAGTYGSTFSSVKINQIEVDAYGRIVSISTGSTGSGSGTMSSFNITNGPSTGVISDNGTLQVAGGNGTSVALSGSGNFGIFTVTNTDRGSAQNIYKNFRADAGGTATANVNNDTLVIAGGTNIETNRSGDTITINAVGGNTDTTYSYASAQSTNDVDLTLAGSDASTNTVKLVAGSNVTLTDNGSNQVTIDAATGTGVGGSGIQNYIPIWSTTSTIGNSAIFQDGTNIGINTTNVNAALDVNGDLKVENTTTAAAFYRQRSSTTGTSQIVKIGTYNPSGGIQDNFGGGIEFSLVEPTNTGIAARIYAVRSGGDSTGTLKFWTGLNGSVNTLNMVSTGQLQLPLYGGTAFSGTATKSLAVDAGGNVIEIDVATSNVQSDWNATSGDAEILNKPTDLVSGTTATQTAVTEIRTLTSGEYGNITPDPDVLYIIV